MSNLSMNPGRLESEEQRGLVEEIICRIGEPISMPKGATDDTEPGALALRHKTTDEIVHELAFVYLGWHSV